MTIVYEIHPAKTKKRQLMSLEVISAQRQNASVGNVSVALNNHRLRAISVLVVDVDTRHFE
jgi:hypothetical protein